MSRWYRLLAPCPLCGRLPAVRLEAWLLVAARNAEPDQPILDYQCQRFTCIDPRTRERTTYVIAAHAIQRAEEVAAA